MCRRTKKIVIMLLLGCICVGLTACGKQQDTGTVDVETVTTVQATENTTTEDETTSVLLYDDTPNTAEPRAYTEDEIEVDITDQTYADDVSDIYVYTEDYLGKMIRVEGLYLGEIYEGRDYHYIYRKGSGCNDAHDEMSGFEFTYNGQMPENGDWIEVVGTLRQYMEGNLAYLTLDAISVTVKEKHGTEDVAE